MFEEHLDLAYALSIYHVCQVLAAICRWAVENCPRSAFPVANMPRQGFGGRSVNGFKLLLREVGIGERVGDTGDVDEVTEDFGVPTVG